MRNAIAVMNTKGGVGKSTIVLALAETLAALHGKNVLVIDSDAQASVSAMLMATTSLRKLQGDSRTLVDYLVATVLRDTQVEWTDYVVGGVSDVDDARSVYVMPSDMQLTLFEREASREAQHGRLRTAIGGLLSRARIVFDVVGHIVQVASEPAIHHRHWRRSAVSTLVEVDLRRQSQSLGRFVDSNAVLGHDIPVIKGMRHEQRRFHVRHRVQVVPAAPEFIHVAQFAIHPLVHLSIAHLAIAVIASRRVAALNKFVEHVDIFADISTGMAN